MPPAAGSLLRLFGSTVGVRSSDVGMALAGANAVAWPPTDRCRARPLASVTWAARVAAWPAARPRSRGTSCGRGSLVLPPRARLTDRDLPFNQVRHNAIPGPLARKKV